MIDAASGGALVDKTPDAARNLIANMAANSQQFGARMDHTSRKVNEVSISNLERQILDLTCMVRQMAVGNMEATRVCGICSLSGHSTDLCPTLQNNENIQQANAMGNFLGQSQRQYDPYSNSYKPSWRDHPNLSYGNQAGQGCYQPPFQAKQQTNQAPNSGMSLNEIVKALANNTMQFQQEVRANMQQTKVSIHNLETQIGQLATTVSKLEAQGLGKLPFQTVVNPQENVSAIMLRSGKEIESKIPHELVKKKQREKEDKDSKDDKVNPQSMENKLTNLVLPPFPSRLAKTKKEEQEKEIFETFRKVEVNIPLIDAIKQIPKYAKFLKKICTTKRKLRGNEEVSVGENVSAMIQRKLP